jgi:hypothetical protein
MAPNSDPKSVFRDIFGRHWSNGRGRPSGTWTTRLFLAAMTKANCSITDDTCRLWLRGQNVPRAKQKDAILRVFFPKCDSEGSGADAEDHREFEAAWERASAETQRSARASGLSDEPVNDWALYEAEHEVAGLVELEPQQPSPGNIPQTYYLHATLRFGTITPTCNDRMVFIGLEESHLSIRASGYLVRKGSMIGERSPMETLQRDASRGVKISGPRDKWGNLSNDALGDEHIAIIESRGTGDENVAIVVAAEKWNVAVAAVEGNDGVRYEDRSRVRVSSAEKEAVLDALLRKGRPADELGRLIVAKATMKRRSRG